MLIIRGVNAFPSQIETVLLNYGYPANYQIIVDRVKSTDTLDVQVEMTPEMFTDNLGEISRRQKRFTSLEELSGTDVAQLAVYDRYSWEYTAFPVGNAVVLIENDRLATALLRLSPKDREIFMMHWFLWMTDEQIAKCMGMARRTVNTRRYKAYRLLKKLMGGEADD